MSAFPWSQVARTAIGCVALGISTAAGAHVECLVANETTGHDTGRPRTLGLCGRGGMRSATNNRASLRSTSPPRITPDSRPRCSIFADMGKVVKDKKKKRDATFDGLLGFKVTKACFDEFLPMLYELGRRKTDGMDYAQARAFADDSIVPIWEAHEMDKPDKHPDIYPPNTTALDARKVRSPLCAPAVLTVPSEFPPPSPQHDEWGPALDARLHPPREHRVRHSRAHPARANDTP